MYKTKLFENKIDWDKVPVTQLNYYNWEGENPYRPKTSFQLAFASDRLEIIIKTDETDIRCECKNTNDPCWEDSCMEFFFAPFGKENGYINVECNSNSVYLSEFGKNKADRVFLNTITKFEPNVQSEVSKDGWKVKIVVDYCLIEDVFKKEFNPLTDDFYFNVYKCGDKTTHPHYGSYKKMTTLPPGFHNPTLFAKADIANV